MRIPSISRIVIRSMLFSAALVPGAHAQHCDRTSCGMLPLDDLGAESWKGEAGGLYPGSQNVRPLAHDDAGRALAATIEPLGSDGLPAKDGKIGLAAIGMSITDLFFGSFQELAGKTSSVAPSVLLANLTTPAKTAKELADPADDYWQIYVPADLFASGITAEQVQVVWMQIGSWIEDDHFPDHALALTDLFVEIAHVLHDVFPNLKLAYLDSIPYMGYSQNPFAYEPAIGEEAFSLKWLIERQIAGDPELEYDASRGTVRSPWLSFGATLWADGVLPRSDGLSWECADYKSDGIHPSAIGAAKGGRLLLHLFSSDPVATPWFLAAGAGRAGHPADVELYGTGTTGTLGEPRIALSELPTIPTQNSVALRTALARPNSRGLFLLGTDAHDVGDVPFAGGWLLVDPRWIFPLLTDASGAGWTTLASVPDDPALSDLVVHAQALLLDPAGPQGSFSLSRGLKILLGD